MTDTIRHEFKIITLEIENPLTKNLNSIDTGIVNLIMVPRVGKIQIKVFFS